MPKKVIIFFLFIINSFHYSFSPPDDDDESKKCRVHTPSELIEISQIGIVKGYFLIQNKNEKEAVFRVIASSVNEILPRDYSVAEYGPFGSKCIMKTVMVPPLDHSISGKENIRYLIVYINLSKVNLITPRTYGDGLFIHHNTMIRDNFFEYADLKAFENFAFHSGKKPKWKNLTKNMKNQSNKSIKKKKEEKSNSYAPLIIGS